MEVFNVYVPGIGEMPVSANSWSEAIEIVQAFLDKHSVNVNWNETNRR